MGWNTIIFTYHNSKKDKGTVVTRKNKGKFYTKNQVFFPVTFIK